MNQILGVDFFIKPAKVFADKVCEWVWLGPGV